MGQKLVETTLESFYLEKITQVDRFFVAIASLLSTHAMASNRLQPGIILQDRAGYLPKTIRIAPGIHSHMPESSMDAII